MKASLDRDIITSISRHAGTEIGRIPPGVGLERMRFDGKLIFENAKAGKYGEVKPYTEE